MKMFPLRSKSNFVHFSSVAGFCKPQEVSMRALSVCSGGVKVTCEYRTHQEGVTQEDLTLVTKGRKDHSLKIRVQAKVIGEFPSGSDRTNARLCPGSVLVLDPSSFWILNQHESSFILDLQETSEQTQTSGLRLVKMGVFLLLFHI